jgi:hypothetical protein
MAVTIKKSKITEVCATGVLVEINNGVISVDDEKNGIQKLDINTLDEMIGKEIILKIRNREDSKSNLE